MCLSQARAEHADGDNDADASVVIERLSDAAQHPEAGCTRHCSARDQLDNSEPSGITYMQFRRGPYLRSRWTGGELFDDGDAGGMYPPQASLPRQPASEALTAPRRLLLTRTASRSHLLSSGPTIQLLAPHAVPGSLSPERREHCLSSPPPGRRSAARAAQYPASPTLPPRRSPLHSTGASCAATAPASSDVILEDLDLGGQGFSHDEAFCLAGLLNGVGDIEEGCGQSKERERAVRGIKFPSEAVSRGAAQFAQDYVPSQARMYTGTYGPRAQSLSLGSRSAGGGAAPFRVTGTPARRQDGSQSVGPATAEHAYRFSALAGSDSGSWVAAQDAVEIPVLARPDTAAQQPRSRMYSCDVISTSEVVAVPAEPPQQDAVDADAGIAISSVPTPVLPASPGPCSAAECIPSEVDSSEEDELDGVLSALDGSKGGLLRGERAHKPALIYTTRATAPLTYFAAAPLTTPGGLWRGISGHQSVLATVGSSRRPLQQTPEQPLAGRRR